MAFIVSYQKHSTPHSIITLLHPEGCTELCTLDDTTYVAIPDGLVLPEQPAEIAASVAEVTLTAELRERIKTESTHCQLIQQRVVERIRARYSMDDEIKLLRIAPSDETAAWNAYVEDCRAWGREQRAKLGL